MDFDKKLIFKMLLKFTYNQVTAIKRKQKLSRYFIFLFISSLPFFTLAWNPFLSSDEIREVSLNGSENNLIQKKAGWSKDDEKTLLFEIHSDLNGPIQCSSVNVELKDGKQVNKSLMPKLFITQNSSKFVSIPNVLKGTMKSYSIICTCFKKKGNGDCINPLKKSNQL
jgi:hypothetical protein